MHPFIQPHRFSMLVRHLRYLVLLFLSSPLFTACSSSSSTNGGRGVRIYHPEAHIPSERPQKFDQEHLFLDIELDHPDTVVRGHVEHRLRYLGGGRPGAPVTAEFDAGPAVSIDGITINGDSARFTISDRIISVAFPDIPRKDDLSTVRISFTSRNPPKGVYFRYDEEGEIEGRDLVYTQGEPTEHHEWFPLADFPSDLMTTETRVRARDDWSVLSNGSFLGVTEPQGGKRTWHYRMEKPHAPYLIAVVAGDYLITKDTTPGVSLEYWSYPDMPERVTPTFHQTGDMIQYFDSLLGIPYPWGIYRQVMVHEYAAGGMENTTATVLNDYLLVDSAIRLDIDPTNTVSHEVVHHWFGDLVTLRDWPHLWVHESFATYLAARYVGSRYGQDKFDERIGRYHWTALRLDNEKKGDPIALGDNQIDMIYGRGAAVLHMLNHVIGDDAFTEGMRLFLRRHSHSVVVSSDVQKAFEEASGRDLQWFFDQWIYGKDHPVVEIDRETKGDSVRYRIKQEPRWGNDTEIFRLPMELVMVYKRTIGGDDQDFAVRRDTVEIGKKWHYTDWLPNRPTQQFITVAPGASVLLEKRYNESIEDSWDRMHVAASSFDRLEAAYRVFWQVANTFGPSATDQLASVAQGIALRFAEEPSPAVRARLIAIGAYARMSMSLDIVRMAIEDPDPEVREAALEYAGIFGEGTLRREYGALLEDPSYAVQASTIYTFIREKEELSDRELQRFSQVLGSQQRVATAYARAVGAQKATRHLDRMIEYAIGGGRWLRRESLQALGKLGVVNDRVTEAIVRGVTSEDEIVIKAAYDAATRLQNSGVDTRIREEISRLPKDRQKQIEEARKGND